MKKTAMLLTSLALLQSQPVFAGRPDFPAYHDQKDSPFDWCAWFTVQGLNTPYRIFCVERA
ncbi:hypothetical protein GRI34_10155 [Erythrobacter aquimaris]|uniref:Uncharacterized protein n=1 Tax=Qipengyuania aquimaris TaxID=255984 RepID=A0A6I4TLV4_9SPHN|nr:hypothetical protein [Qipengyuania aquimaris]MXO96776.1 hypothetical protein [Qipengyuania aquimaris]